MNSNQLDDMHSWFDDYTKSFLTGNALEDGPLVLKIDHTQRVCGNMRLISKSLGMDDEQVRIADAIGLFHDVGRFEQFRRFRTFSDRQSINHAVLGVEILERYGVLQDLGPRVQHVVAQAVHAHNAPRLPSGRNSAELPFMRLIRDADKLDIWKVFGDIYRSGQPIDAALVHDLPDLPTCSAVIVAAVMKKQPARFGDIRCRNDFKLCQLSWVFDLNLRETFVQAKKRGDLKAIALALPNDPATVKAIAAVMVHLDEMASRP